MLKIIKIYKHKLQYTFPSYSFLSKTSGAIYAGVPTVDFGCECSTEDWKIKTMKMHKPPQIN
jgi:hypothetical protein